MKESNISFFWFIESGIVFPLKSAKEVNRSVLQLLKLCPLHAPETQGAKANTSTHGVLLATSFDEAGSEPGATAASGA